jgi:hypothetical protein
MYVIPAALQNGTAPVDAIVDDMDLFGYKMVFELDNKLSSYTNI